MEVVLRQEAAAADRLKSVVTQVQYLEGGQAVEEVSLQPGVKVMKPFVSVTDAPAVSAGFRYNKNVQPGLVFESKAGAYLSRIPNSDRAIGYAQASLRNCRLG